MKRTIALVAGGYSGEYEVSLKSADGLYSFIDKTRYDIHRVLLTHDEWSVLLADGTRVPIDRNDFSYHHPDGRHIHFDFAYITIHGTPGEDGRLQGYFDMLSIPYSTCGALASALTFNKYTCTQFLRSQGVRVSDAIRLRRGDAVYADEVVNTLSLPVFVKPNAGGSSLGTTKVKEATQIDEAVRRAFACDDEVIIERFVSGTEVTCGCYKAQADMTLLPVTEVVTGNDFFDFDAKYNGQVSEITPARISAGMTQKIQDETRAIYYLIGAKGIIRVDFIIPSDGSEPVMLEINTTPGMTETSFIPQQIRAAGLCITDVLTEIIENELQSDSL
ncbi:D-alanine--D-alanine ligase A [Tannerella sp. oral taxon 808]|nr:D-alanine--D-alanine ligase A [Tannerella sp. oral taxon 808]